MAAKKNRPLINLIWWPSHLCCCDDNFRLSGENKETGRQRHQIKVWHLMCIRSNLKGWKIMGSPRLICIYSKTICIHFSTEGVWVAVKRFQSSSQLSQRDIINLRTLLSPLLMDTHFFSRLPAPVSLKPFANGLLSIFNWVICKKEQQQHQFTGEQQET